MNRTHAWSFLHKTRRPSSIVGVGLVPTLHPSIVGVGLVPTLHRLVPTLHRLHLHRLHRPYPAALLALLAACAAVFLTALDQTVVVTALPQIITDLQIPI